jgi:hypothetical protein
LGSRFEHPVRAVHDCPPEELQRRLGALDWAAGAWGAGAIVDGLATGIFFNVTDFAKEFSDGGVGPLSTLVGWLTLRAKPATGLWGSVDVDRLAAVNGCYRLTRGSYAQFGLPLPYPEATVRTVLEHAHDERILTGDGYNACNILDVIHPLWLAGQQTDAQRA